jgi:hypothetical protein
MFTLIHIFFALLIGVTLGFVLASLLAISKQGSNEEEIDDLRERLKKLTTPVAWRARPHPVEHHPDWTWRYGTDAEAFAAHWQIQSLGVIAEVKDI